MKVVLRVQRALKKRLEKLEAMADRFNRRAKAAVRVRKTAQRKPHSC